MKCQYNNHSHRNRNRTEIVKFMRHLFVVDSLDKQIQNEKELIHLASAGEGGYFVFVWRVLT